MNYNNLELQIKEISIKPKQVRHPLQQIKLKFYPLYKIIKNYKTELNKLKKIKDINRKEIKFFKHIYLKFIL